MSKISLKDIHIDPELQPRVDGIDPAHVAVLQNALDSWPPISVVATDGCYLLVDGFHRYAAAQNLGLTEIAVTVLPPPADGDLHALAFSLNAAHGRPLSLDDRRSFATRLLTQNASASNMEVSRQAGLSPSTISALRERLEAAEQIDVASERIDSNGNRYPAPSDRPAGQLPDRGLSSIVGNALGKLITPGQRAQQRKLTQYFERLAAALEDQESLEGWDTTAQAAEACALVLGEGRATQLGERLGWTSRNVLDVAYALGFTDEDDAA